MESLASRPARGEWLSRSNTTSAAAVPENALAGKGASVGPLALEADTNLTLPGPDWVKVRPRLAGICGSDLALVDGTASAYFDPLVSYPFTPGHEVVGDAEMPDGTTQRVVLVPVLSCVTRGIEPMCHACQRGAIHLCERVAFGHLEPGLQTGFCTSTGGGWGTELVAHVSQLVPVPDDLSDEAAVMVEPTACAVHAAARYTGTDTVIIGAGTLGLLTLAAITANRGADRTAGHARREGRPSEAPGVHEHESAHEVGPSCRGGDGGEAADGVAEQHEGTTGEPFQQGWQQGSIAEGRGRDLAPAASPSGPVHGVNRRAAGEVGLDGREVGGITAIGVKQHDARAASDGMDRSPFDVADSGSHGAVNS